MTRGTSLAAVAARSAASARGRIWLAGSGVERLGRIDLTPAGR